MPYSASAILSASASWLVQLWLLAPSASIVCIFFVSQVHCLIFKAQLQIPLSQWSLPYSCYYKLYSTYPLPVTSHPLPCITFIQYISSSKILLDMLIRCLLPIPSTRMQDIWGRTYVYFVCTVSPAPKSEKMLSKCQMAVWMKFSLSHWLTLTSAQWCSVRANITVASLCVPLWTQLPQRLVWLGQLLGIVISPGSFLNEYHLAVIGRCPPRVNQQWFRDYTAHKSTLWG